MNTNIKIANIMVLNILIINLLLSSLMLLFDSFLAQIIIYVLLSIYCLKTAKKKRIKFSFHKPDIKMTLLCAGITISAFPIANLMNYIGTAYMGGTQMAVDISRPVWLLILVMAVIPAVAEEITYRGLIQGAYMKESILYSVLFSSIAFALMHFHIGAMMYSFLYGCIFAIVRIVTENLFYPIIMHILFNAINISTLCIGSKDISMFSMTFLAIAGSVLCTSMIYVLCRSESSKFVEQIWSVKEFISKESIIAYMICIILTVCII